MFFGIGVGVTALSKILSLDDFEKAACHRLPKSLFGYVHGGTETNSARAGNRAAFDALSFVPRQLVGVANRNSSIELFGRNYCAPFGIAPMGISALTAYRGDLIQARAAASAGIPMIQSSSSLISVEEVQQEFPGTWFQAYLPREESDAISMLDRLSRCGVEVLVITVDSSVVPNRENNLRNNFRMPMRPNLKLVWDGVTHPRWTFQTFLRTLVKHGMPHFENVGAKRGEPIISRNVDRDFTGREHLQWETIASIRRCWKGPLVLKGILHPEDARKAKVFGLDGVIVSNHGGRQLDYAVAPLKILPRIVDAASDICIMIDSGFRRGTDVLKAIGLGARCAFIGRPFNYAGATAGLEGVIHAIQLLQDEIRADMGLLGINQLAELGPDMLFAEMGFYGACAAQLPDYRRQ